MMIGQQHDSPAFDAPTLFLNFGGMLNAQVGGESSSLTPDRPE